MYFRNMGPSTTCLYSAASMLFLSLSAAAQRVASKPRVATLLFVLLLRLPLAMSLHLKSNTAQQQSLNSLLLLAKGMRGKWIQKTAKQICQIAKPAI